MSVTLAQFNDPVPQKKIRVVEVFKNNVYGDIDKHTFKYTDASDIQSPRQENAIASDTGEALDAATVSELVEFRDAQLRRIVVSRLAPKNDFISDDDARLIDNKYRYVFEFPVEFNDNLLRPLAKYFRRFLAWGALYDWYAQMGLLQQANTYKTELDNIENEIRSIMVTPSIVKRPMQPFGPAQKLRW